MTWSTRELADLAGTTVNTIRHYHSLDLLTAPERRYNGYKQYRVHHLVRVIQLRRIVELGVPLAQADTATGDESASRDELRELDSRVVAEIERLQRSRIDIAALLSVGASVDTPRGFEAIVGGLSEQDRSLIHIFTRLHDEGAASRLRAMVAEESIQGRSAFDALRSDADEKDRRRVAALLRTGEANWRSTDRPWLRSDVRRPRGNSQEIRAAIVEIVDDLYNAAQRDVIDRIAVASRPIELRERHPLSVAQSA